MKILLLRLLDYLGSKWRRFWKIRKLKRKWGNAWFDKSRTGRKYSRVRPEEDSPEFTGRVQYFKRSEPGWEWSCQNCRIYSIITESMMPAILKDWEKMAENAATRGYRPPPRPMAATAGCPNCKFRPGDPE